MAYLTTTTANDSAFVARIVSAFETLALRMRQRKLYRETFDALSGLSDRELADLDLHRAQLRDVAWDTASKAVR